MTGDGFDRPVMANLMFNTNDSEQVITGGLPTESGLYLHVMDGGGNAASLRLLSNGRTLRIYIDATMADVEVIQTENPFAAMEEALRDECPELLSELEKIREITRRGKRQEGGGS